VVVVVVVVVVVALVTVVIVDDGLAFVLCVTVDGPVWCTKVQRSVGGECETDSNLVREVVTRSDHANRGLGQELGDWGHGDRTR
jgi:hypothetical protein